jgi:hypothetical protein
VLGEILPETIGLIENIYSDDPKKQRQAMESLERENDLLLMRSLKTIFVSLSEKLPMEKERIYTLN